ncbi:ferrous iron transport protein B [Clostridium sp. CAG:470]|nr:ferrous iron transport protein B [Clostridium sp. CAG:470]
MKNTYIVALAGNPNVGKSTIFNSLTGMHQHTGNWTGKTVANATGKAIINDKEFTFVDIPGTYSIMSNSEEEEIARDYICFGNPDATVIVVDSTCLERNLNLVYQIMEITDNIIVCVNLLDEAKKKKIKIDLKKLEDLLGVPVVGTVARDKQTLENLKNTIYKVCEGEIRPHTKTVIYEQEIEENLEKIVGALDTDSLKNEYLEKRNIATDIEVEENKISKKLYRWIAIKLIDGEEKILKSIQENLELNLGEQEIRQSVIEAKKNLETREITSKNFKDKIVADIMKKAEETSKEVCTFENKNYRERDLKIDKILTSKIFGIPIMILFLGLIFWITIVGANYPSEWLFSVFNWLQDKLIYFANYIHCPIWLSDMLINGVYKTLTWIVAVMLPPMAIFFPLFTILEDLGYLPRIAFNMDGFFKKACCSGKQMITMCMGFGCNACGVTGCRIIDSPRERLIAILTNNFVPCNGRFPFLITIATIFIAGAFAGGNGFLASILSTFAVIIVIIFGIFLTLVISKILSKTILKGMPSSMILELPPYRKPQFGKILVRSIFDRTLFVLGRAISVAAPAGLVIWLMANIGINGQSLLSIIANFLNPFAKLMGLDGYILTAFILGIPANEIVLPIILMCYLKSGTLVNIEDTIQIGQILIQNGWTMLTAMNVMLFTILHFPCATTLLTVKKETGSWKWTAISFAIPTVCGIVLCMFTNLVYNFILVY